MSANLNEIVGTTPNVMWLRVGQFMVALGALAYLGGKVAGVEFIEDMNGHEPIIIILMGFGSMYYGSRLARIKQIAERNHELDMAEKRKSDRPKQEPTRGNSEFIKWFSGLSHPITVVELSKESFPYDAKRTKPQLLSALNSMRAEWWTNHGEIIKLGDTYRLRDDNNQTIIQ